MLRFIICFAAGTCAISAHADSCPQDFASSGSVLTGQRFKSSAALVGVVPEDAFSKALAYTKANGLPAVDNNGMIQPAQYTPPPLRKSALVGFAIATPEQQSAIAGAIPKTIPNAQIHGMVDESNATIATFVERISCMVAWSGSSALNVFAAPGTNLGNNFGLFAMSSMRYHDKASCLTVARIQGWNAPANNALRFEVLYKADDSGETAKLVHEMVKQPDGSWLFTH